MKDHLRSDWTGAILVCGKCSRKLGGGFGDDGRTSLTKLLRRALGLGKGRRNPLGVVETKCLDVCPKRAVVIVDTARPGRWEIVAPGLSASEILTRLGRAQP
ncbi:(2Fe-2S) ferredoxin domain-containing protein [Sphingomonas sp.]|uniref:(2Fe-2S) ferredoxin domain-containing protein n=1 Tax=Sphingomonas sp. TaxID=28214 RepID=UPI002ED9487F